MRLDELILPVLNDVRENLRLESPGAVGCVTLNYSVAGCGNAAKFATDKLGLLVPVYSILLRIDTDQVALGQAIVHLHEETHVNTAVSNCR